MHKFGHVPELLVTFGLSYLILEAGTAGWGRSTVPYGLPEQLQGPLFTLYGTQFPKSRSFIMLVALLDAAGGVAAADAHAHRPGDTGRAQAPRDGARPWATTCRACSCWCSAAVARWPALAGVIGGNTYVTEPAMAASVGSIIFVVVVVGGMGSLAGAFLASLLIGIVQTLAVALDYSLASALQALGIAGGMRAAWAGRCSS